jgi:uncharacterized protein YecT (DUF1311 family)
MISGLILLAAGAAAVAPPTTPGDPGWNCANPQGQVETNMCAMREFDVAVAAMDAQLKLTQSTLQEADKGIDRTRDDDPTSVAMLVSAQKSWMAYRDDHCVNESYFARGGTMQPFLLTKCQTKLTEQRTKQLKDLAEIMGTR